MKPVTPATRSLLVRTALASGIIAIMPGVAQAQSLPTGQTIVSGAPGIGTAGNTMTVDLNAQNAIINWQTFDVPTGKTLSYISTNAGPSNVVNTTPVAVLNRVVGAAGTLHPSTINGQLDSGNSGNNNIKVWVVNQAGITYAPANAGSVYNGGSLILSTLDVPNSDFTGGTSASFSEQALNAGAYAGTTAYEAGAPKAIAISGDLATNAGDLIIVAKNVTLGVGAGPTRNIGAAGNLVVVAANAVSFGDIGSPLTFTIGQGTTLLSGDASGVTVKGKTDIAGQSVTIASVSQAVAITNLLQINDQSSITANAANGVVTLATRAVDTISVTTENANDAIQFGATTGANTPTISATGATAKVNIAAKGDLAFKGDLAANANGTLLAQGATIALDTGAVSYGTQTWDGPVTLGANTTITGSAAFKSTVDSDATARSLSISAAGTFDGAVGTTALNSLVVSGAAAINGGAVTTVNGQSYGATTLDAPNTLLTGTTVAFTSTLRSATATPRNLVVDAVLTLGGAVGSVNQLGNFEAKKATRINGGSVSTSGTQTYDAAVTLGANTALTATTATFSSTLDSAAGTTRNLGITGNAVFSAAVGNTDNLGTLSVSGTSALNGATVETANSQTYTGAATLGVNTVLTATAGTIGFGSTLDGGFTLGLVGNGSFGGAVGLGTALTMIDVSGSSALNAGTIKTTGNQTYTGAATIGADLQMIGTGAGALVDFKNTVNSSSGAHSLQIDALSKFEGAVGGTTKLASFSTTFDTTISGGAFGTTGDQTYGGTNLNLVGNTDLTSTTGTVKLQALVGNVAPIALQVLGDAAIDQSLGGVTAMGSFKVTGNTAFQGTAATVATVNDQTYGSVTLARDMTLSSTNAGKITFGGAVDSSGAQHSLALQGTPANKIEATFNGAVGGVLQLSQLTITDALKITATANIKTTGTIALDSAGPIAVAGLTSTAGDVLINQLSPIVGTVAVNGPVQTAGDYKLKATSVNLSGVQTAPGKIEITSTTGDITGGATASLVSNFGGVSTTNWIYLDSAGTINLASGSSLDAGLSDVGIRAASPNITLGDVKAAHLGQIDILHTFTDGLTAGAFNNLTTGVLDLGTAISLDVTGALSVDGIKTAGIATLSGASVKLGKAAGTSQSQTLDVTATATDITLAGAIDTTGFTQDYHGPVKLGSLTTLTATTATFDNAVDGAGGLAVTGDASFGGTVGAATPLASLSVTGTTQLTAPSVHTVGNQTYGSSVILNADTHLTSDSGLVHFQSLVDSDFVIARQLDITGNAQFDSVVGFFVPLKGLTVSGTSALNGSLIATTLGQTYTGAVTLGADTTLYGSGVTFSSTLDSDATDRALAINANASFAGLVGSTNKLASLTITAPATISATDNISTSGAISLDAPTSIALAGLDAGGNIAINQTGVPGSVTVHGTVLGGADYKAKGTTIDLTGSQSAVGKIDLTSTTGSSAVATITGDSTLVLRSDSLGLNPANWLMIDSAGAINLAAGSLLDGGSAPIGLRYAAGADITLGDVTGDGLGLLDAGHASITVVPGLTNVHNFTAGTITTTGTAWGVIGTGAVQVDVANANGQVTLQGNTVSLGKVGGTSTASGYTLTSTGGAITLVGAIDSGAGNQSYTGAVTLSGNTALTAGTATFSSTVDGPGGLAVSGNAGFGGSVGAATALDALHVTGTSSLTGTVHAVNAVTLDGATTLTGNTSVISDNNLLFFNGTIDSDGIARSLTVTGTTTFGGELGGISQLDSLTANDAVLLTDGRITTVNNQTFNDTVSLASNAVLTSAAGLVDFTSTIDNAGLPAQSLSVLGNARFGGAIGLSGALLSVAVSGTSAINTGSIDTIGTQTYTGPATVGTDATLTGSTISFLSMLTGAHDLTLDGDGVLGGTTSLHALHVTGGSTIKANVTTTLGQQYDGAVGLVGGPLNLSGTLVDFQSTLDGASALTVTGGAKFAAAVGGIARLNSLHVTGASAINGGSVRSNGAQSFDGATTLGADTTLDAAGALVSFGSTLDSAGAPRDLVITGGARFDGAVGNTLALNSLDVSGATTINGLTVKTNGNQTYRNAVTLGNNTILIGTIDFLSTINGPFGLTVTGDGTFGGGVSIAGLSVLGSSALNGGTVTTTGLQSYAGPATLGANTILNATQASFGSTLDSSGPARTLTINGAGRFDGVVGAGNALQSIAVSGATDINTSAITTNATQHYSGAVTLGASGPATTLTGIAITFGGTVNGGKALTVTGAGTFNGVVGGGTALSALTVTGAAALNGNAVTTSGAQSYQGAVTLGTDNLLTGSQVDFLSTVDGGKALTVAGNASFAGAVGSVLPALTALNVSGATLITGPSITTSGGQDFGGAVSLGADVALTGSTVQFHGTVDSQNATARDLTVTGATTFDQAVGGTNQLKNLAVTGTTAIDGGVVSTAGTQTYNGAATLGADATLTGTSVDFAATVDSNGAARKLTIAGNATLGGAVGGTSALDTLAVSGTTALNGPAVTTTAGQTYTGAASLGSNATLTAGGAGVTFGNTLDGAHDLTILGTADFAGPVGGTTPLTLLAVTAPGAITSGGAVTVAGPVTLNGATVNLTGLLSATGATGAVGITTTGATTLDGVQAGAGLTVNADSLTVTNAADAAGAISLTTVGATNLGSTKAGGTLAITAGTLTVGGQAESGGAMTLGSAGAVQLGSLKSASTAAVTGSSVAVTGLADTVGTLALTATGTTLDVGSISSADDVTLIAKTKATLGAVTAGSRTVTLSAADADLNGTVNAGTVAIIDNAGAGNSLVIGDGIPAGDLPANAFTLSADEVNRIAATTVALDAGTGTGLTRQDVLIGNLTLTNAALQNLNVMALQRIDVSGGISGTGSGLKSLQLGGTSTGTDMATVLRIAAKGDGSGGKIDVGTAVLDLRAVKIGVGQDTGFLANMGLTPGSTATQTAEFMVSNASSSLYNSIVGGGTVYLPSAQQVIIAGKLTVSYSDFALFQNTGLVGGNEGVKLASQANPATPALVLNGPNPPLGGPFGIFGQINGFTGIQTAILGPTVVVVNGVSRQTARINGCLIGSAAGCLSSTALMAGLKNFTPVRATIIFAAADFEMPFDPLVATNNDSLFGDVGTFGLSDIVEPPMECSPTNGKDCANQKEGTK